MDDDRRLTVPGARAIPVHIAGSWDEHDWRGTVSADEELAAVLLVRDANGIGWSRSRRTGPDGLELIFSAGSDPSLGVTWFTLELGGGRCWGRIAGKLKDGFANSDPAPHTGSVIWFQICDRGEFPIKIGLLPLVRSDVRFGRKRIWRLRPALRESLNEVLRQMLVERRYGAVP